MKFNNNILIKITYRLFCHETASSLLKHSLYTSLTLNSSVFALPPPLAIGIILLIGTGSLESNYLNDRPFSSKYASLSMLCKQQATVISSSHVDGSIFIG